MFGLEVGFLFGWLVLFLFLFKNGIQIFCPSSVHRDPHENRCCSPARISDISLQLFFLLPVSPCDLWFILQGQTVGRVEQVLVTKLHQRRDAKSAIHRGKTPSAHSHSPKQRVFPEGGEIQEVFCLPANLQDTWQAEKEPWLFRACDTALPLASLCKDLRGFLKIFLPMFLIKKVTIWPLNQNLSHTFPSIKTSKLSLFLHSQTRVWWMEILWHGNREPGICLMLGRYENLVSFWKYHPCLSHRINRAICGGKGCST